MRRHNSSGHDLLCEACSIHTDLLLLNLDIPSSESAIRVWQKHMLLLQA